MPDFATNSKELPKMGQKGVLDHGEDLHFISLSLKMMIKSAYYMTKVSSNLCSLRLSKTENNFIF